MTPELGHFSLILALMVSAVLSVLPLRGAARHEPSWQAVARPAVFTLFSLLSFSFACLVYAYVTADFSVRNVVENSHTLKPLLYKISGVWGNHEGSMLLWVWMLSGWGAVYALARRRAFAAFDARTLSVQGMIACGFIAFILFTSNPFARLIPAAEEGLDLNPVLQDPALAIHPPLLYMGYVGFSISFCLAVAALLDTRVDRSFAAALKPWVLAAWCFLTAGIALGSFWAYYELGWGGFWFWDPVENASLLPWLSGTALLHSVAVLQKRDALKNWTLFLSILAFSLSLLGTFLVRSGVLTSVHAFASDPSRGIFILALMVLAVGGALALYAVKGPKVEAGAPFPLFSREAALLINNVFLFTFTTTVLIGTLYPVILSALDLPAVSVGTPYYKAIFLPMLLPFALLMGAAPLVNWGAMRASRLMHKALLPLAGALVLAVLSGDTVILFVSFLSAFWIVFATLRDLYMRSDNGRRIFRLPPAYHGMALAHVGFALLVMGAAAATQLSSEKTLWMKAGDDVIVAGYQLTFVGSTMTLGDNYTADRGLFLARKGENRFFLAPEKRWYPATARETSETALKAEGVGILYAVLGDQDRKDLGRFVVRIYYHPLILLIYIGVAMMVLGGALSLSGARKAGDADE